MVDLKQIKNIYLYGDGVSFRGGIDGLSNLILTHFSENEVDKNLIKELLSKMIVNFDEALNQAKKMHE